MYMGNNDSKYKGRRTKPDLLGGVRSPIIKSHFVARNTIEYFADHDMRYIRLHDTDILEFSPTHVRMNSGGWKTSITKDRINENTPAGFNVWTDKGVWHVRTPALADVIFFDGIAFNLPSGTLANEGQMFDAVRKVTADRKLIDAYMRAARKVGCPSVEDSLGDPFVWPDKSGKIEADMMREWLVEKYVFRKMFAWAFKYAGMNDLGLSMHVDEKWNRGRVDQIVYRRLRRYIRVCLGMGD